MKINIEHGFAVCSVLVGIALLILVAMLIQTLVEIQQIKEQINSQEVKTESAKDINEITHKFR